MKRYTELTQEELVLLKEEDVERFIEIEIASEGIMPVACPEVPSLESEGITRTEVAYEVGGLLFKKEDDAIAVSGMEQFSSTYDYLVGGYDYKWLDPVLEKTVTKKHFYRQTDVARIKDVLQRNAEKHKIYEKQKNEYDKFLSSTGKIRDAVYAAWRDALDLQQQFNDAKNIFEKYCNLADGDKEIAAGFFKNTYKTRLDIIEKVLGVQEIGA